MDIPQEFEIFRERLKKISKTANDIKFIPGETKPWESKLGGCPYLENIKNYPIDEKGTFMFLAQINLDEMPNLEDFPEHGILQFYVLYSDEYWFGKPFVRYIEEYYTDENKLVKENPYLAEYQNMQPFLKSGKAKFKQREVFADMDSPQMKDIINEADENEKHILSDICNTAGCRIGGYPLFIGTVPDYYKDGTADVLLLQLDIDQEAGGCGIMFGDAGNCQFLISKEDLLNKDFSKVKYEMSCC